MNRFLTGKASGGKPAFLCMECLENIPVFILDDVLKTLQFKDYHKDIRRLCLETESEPAQ